MYVWKSKKKTIMKTGVTSILHLLSEISNHSMKSSHGMRDKSRFVVAAAQYPTQCLHCELYQNVSLFNLRNEKVDDFEAKLIFTWFISVSPKYSRPNFLMQWRRH